MSVPFFEFFPDVWVYLTAEGRVLDYRAQPTSEFYLTPELWQNKTIQTLLPLKVGAMFDDTLQQVLRTGHPASLEYTLASAQSNAYYEVRVLPAPPDRAIAILRNISDLKRTEEGLRHNAFHDSLTGLPNRSLFIDRLEMALRRFKRHPKFYFAVFFIDLDGFKQVNDQLGHGVGDQLLAAIAELLRGCVRANDTVARLGGDEFTVLLDSITDIAEVRQVAERILAKFTAPFLLSGHSICSGASIGIVLSAFRYQKAADLLHDADIALYQAKRNGKGQYAFFEFNASGSSRPQP